MGFYLYCGQEISSWAGNLFIDKTTMVCVLERKESKKRCYKGNKNPSCLQNHTECDSSDGQSSQPQAGVHAHTCTKSQEACRDFYDFCSKSSHIIFLEIIYIFMYRNWVPLHRKSFDLMPSTPTAKASSQTQFLANTDPLRWQWWLKQVTSCQTCGRPELYPWLLVPADGSAL